MIRGDLSHLIEALREPVRAFVRDARIRVALLVSSSGQLLAQHGFSRGYEVANVASLAAAAHASARALADMTGAGPWTYLHQVGKQRQLFLAPFATPAEELILVAIFDDDSSLGLVLLYFDDFARRIAALPQFRTMDAGGTAETFEHDLEAGLRHVMPPDWL
ncbi:MAG TPA: roadblock/LC7 domain-containing protein [Longimicrobiales bacterium]